MSRTIKTMPPAIIARDTRAIEPWHDHRRGVCDLPPPTWEYIGWVLQRHCQWTYADSFYYTHQFCGCHSCTEHDQRRIERRRSRHQAKAEARRFLKYGED